MRKIAYCINDVLGATHYEEAKRGQICHIMQGMIMGADCLPVCHMHSEVGETCFQIIKIYSNTDITRLFDNGMLAHGDKIWAVPASKGLAFQAKNSPYIYDDEIEMMLDYKRNPWCPESNVEWTINQIHPWLEEFIIKV